MTQVRVESHRLGGVSHPPASQPAGPQAGQHQCSVRGWDPDPEDLLRSSAGQLVTSSQERG